jgi:preprotein translocase subunit YajC
MESLILPLALLLLFVPLILSFRRQRRQYNEMQQLQGSLQVGDRVMTTSGLQGTIVATTDETIDLEIAPDVVTTWVRQAVRERLTEPADTAETDTVDSTVDRTVDRGDAVPDEADNKR